MLNQTKETAANGGAVVGFGTWFITHIVQIDEVTQFVLLIASIVAAVLGAIYHWKRIRKS